MRVFLWTSGLAAAIMLGALLWTGSVAAKATYVTFSIGHYGTNVTGINSSNTIAGYYQTDNGNRSGFVRAVDGTITTFDVAGAVDTQPWSINDAGIIAGLYYTSSSPGGFTRAADGTITTFDLPGTYEPYVVGINNKGEIAGEWGGDPTHGFIRGSHGKLTTFDGPGSSGPNIAGFNDKGVVVGGYFDSDTGHGFARAADGTITTIDIPGAYNAGASGINAKGVIAGWYSDDGPCCTGGGFIRTPDGTTTKFGVPGYVIYAARINRGGVVAATCIGSGKIAVICVRYPNGTIRLIHNKSIPYLSDTGAIAGIRLVIDEQTHRRTPIGFVRFP